MSAESTSDPGLDLVIPVYNEGDSIRRTLDALFTTNKSPFRVYIVYDFDEDNTLPVLDSCPAEYRKRIIRIKNEGRGPHSAVLTGFRKSTAPAVLMYPADDDFNLSIVDRMYEKWKREGCDIVCASRFIRGGCMDGCPWLKKVLVRASAFALYHFAGIPTHDASNGFRLFSRRILDEIPIESNRGFTYSIELLVKTHRRGWKICEVPAKWFERSAGQSRFRVLKWLPAYLRWFFYGISTTWLGRKSKG